MDSRPHITTQTCKYTKCFTLSPSTCVPLQDSSSGNTSDVESQEGGSGHGHKSKGKDRTSMPGKDGSHRHSSSHKATPGYKVEDKTTWTLLQQQQQHFSTPSSSFYYYHSLTPSIPPPLPSFLHFFLWLLQIVSFLAGTSWQTQSHTLGFLSSVFVFMIATWLSPPLYTRLWAIRTV